MFKLTAFEEQKAKAIEKIAAAVKTRQKLHHQQNSPRV